MFVDYLDRGFSLDPEATCMARADGSLRLSHGEFSELTHRVAAALQERGLGEGGKVAVFAPNDPLGYATVIGVLRAGAGWVALNPKSEHNELTRLLAMLDCDFLIYSAAFRERAQALLDAAPGIRGSAMFGDGQLGADFESWLAPPGARADPLPHGPTRPLMYLGTGGTTGAPKGIVVNDRQFCVMTPTGRRTAGPST
jgi:acyl-CoA synthetase (AMP-forming)/AMP-acid ligase II